MIYMAPPLTINLNPDKATEVLEATLRSQPLSSNNREIDTP